MEKTKKFLQGKAQNYYKNYVNPQSWDEQPNSNVKNKQEIIGSINIKAFTESPKPELPMLKFNKPNSIVFPKYDANSKFKHPTKNSPELLQKSKIKTIQNKQVFLIKQTLTNLAQPNKEQAAKALVTISGIVGSPHEQEIADWIKDNSKLLKNAYFEIPNRVHALDSPIIKAIENHNKKHFPLSSPQKRPSSR